MIRVLGFLLLLMALTAASNCPYTIDPVCGSDGELYYNECTLKEQTKGKYIHVEDWVDCDVDCDGPRTCTSEHMPQCGSDGKIYGNRCTFLWASCRLLTPLKHEPIINCINKHCPNNCDDADVDCKAKVADCRKPWERYIGIYDP